MLVAKKNPSTNLPILLYHRIDKSDGKTTLCVPPQHFLEHMVYLVENGYQAVSLNDLVSCQKEKLPRKSVAITFDDGYEDNYLNAFPVLKKFNFTATVFVVANQVGKTNRWDEIKGWPTVKLMDWPQIMEMNRSGISIGSHSLNHVHLNKLRFLPRLANEIGHSKKIIERHMGKPVHFFSYPYGNNNFFVRFLTRWCGYRGACIVNRPSPATGDHFDPFGMSRVEINSENSSTNDFKKLLESHTRPKLNILQVCTHDGWGGQELYSARLAAKLKERGHNVIFVLRKNGFLQPQIEASGINTEYLRIRSSMDVRAIIKLIRVIKRRRVNVVHGHVARDFWPVVIASKLTGAKVVLSRHLLTPLSKWTLKMLNCVDEVIAVSGAAKDNLSENGFLTAEGIKIIHHGVDLALFYPDNKDREKTRAALGFGKDDFVIGNIGHMGCKGQRTLVEALGEISAKHPHVKCLLVSNPDPDIPGIKKTAFELGVQNKLVFINYQENIPRIMNMLDLFCIVPKAEAFGLVLVEAMACAKPVVASNVGGIKEIIQDKVHGLLVPPKDVHALSEALAYIIENPNKAREMGLKGRDLVRERFDLERHVDKIEEIYFGQAGFVEKAVR